MSGPVTEREQLSLSIHFATLCLESVRPKARFDHPPENAKVRDTVKPGSRQHAFQRIASIFSTCGPDALPGAFRPPIAVAATFPPPPHGIHGLVVAALSNPHPKQTISVRQIPNNVNLQTVLDQSRSRSPRHDIDDSLAIIRAINLPDHSNSEEVGSIHHRLRCFLVGRGYRLFAGRLLKFRQIFTKHPFIDNLEEFDWGCPEVQSELEEGSFYVDQFFPLELKLSGRQQRIRSVLESHGIHSIPEDEYTYRIDIDDLPLWACACAGTFRALEGSLLNVPEDAKEWKLPATYVHLIKNPPTASDCERAVGALLDLQALLDCGFIPLLFEFPAVYRTMRGLENFVPNYERDASQTQVEAKVLHEDIRDPYMCETEGDHVIRLLKSILAPIEATLSPISKNHSSLDADFHLVSVSPQPPLRPELSPEEGWNAFIATVLSKLTQEDFLFAAKKAKGNEAEVRNGVEKMLHKLYPECKPKRDLLAGAPLHTQAALMGLACAFRAEDGRRTHQSLLGLDDGLAGALEEIFQDPACVVGTGKRCCYCCWEFSEWLQAHRESAIVLNTRVEGRCGVVEVDTTLPPSAELEFALEGTHDIIHEWGVPPVGVPLEFLRDLKDKLVVQAKTLAYLLYVINRSGDGRGE